MENPVEKPLILAIETATPVCSVSLFSAGKVLACYEYEGQKLHAKMLAPLIDRILNDRDLKPSDLDAIAVGKGPGSYTGLRVGVATAKGLCMSLKLPLIACDSLEGIASSVLEMAEESDALICPMLDARRMEVYCAIYDTDLNAIEPVQAKIIETSSFGELLAKRKVIFLGEGSDKCREILGASANAIFVSDTWASARNFVKIATEKFAASDFEDLISFEPHYLKDFVATKPKKKL